MTEEQERQETIKCVVWGVCFVFAWLCLMLYGMAWLTTAEKTSADVYGAVHLESRITALESHIHPETNKGFTGKAIK